MAGRSLRAGAALLVLASCAAIFAPVLSPYTPGEQHLAAAFAPPGPGHPLGQDRLGRDIWSRVVHGARVSLLVGACTVVVSLVLGVAIGTAAGYRGGLTDEMFMRTVDILQAFPGILLAIALTAVLGPGVLNIILALSALGWVGYARVARGQALSLRSREFVTAARAIGAGEARILFRHLVPNLMGPLVVQAGFGMASAILAESSLSFLGLGVQTMPSWGKMLSEGMEFLGRAPHLAVFPGLAIMGVVLGSTLVGEGIRDIMDPQGKP